MDLHEEQCSGLVVVSDMCRAQVQWEEKMEREQAEKGRLQFVVHPMHACSSEQMREDAHLHTSAHDL